MEVPGTLDTSEILEQAQELAADLVYIENDEISDEGIEIYKEEVSVEVINPQDKFKPVWTDFLGNK
jgi:hypothetical protein